jgi:hypothetical protein
MDCILEVSGSNLGQYTNFPDVMVLVVLCSPSRKILR